MPMEARVNVCVRESTDGLAGVRKGYARLGFAKKNGDHSLTRPKTNYCVVYTEHIFSISSI